MPGEYDRYNMKRVVSLTANIEGEDLGRVATSASIRRSWTGPEQPPRGVPRGRPRPDRADAGDVRRPARAGWAWRWSSIFLLLTAYFQSLRLALVSVAAVPAVIAGVVVMLWLTGTTLNIQSFMGAIMAIGVAVANAILLVTFAERNRRRGPAGRDAPPGPRSKGRSTAPADPDDQLRHARRHGPDGSGLGEGGEQTAPSAAPSSAGWWRRPCHPVRLALGVRGGPGRSRPASASLDPRDPASVHFHPDAASRGIVQTPTGRRQSPP